MSEQEQPEQELSPLELELRQIQAEEKRLAELKRDLYRRSIRETDPTLKLVPDFAAEFIAESDEDGTLEFPIQVNAVHLRGGELLEPWKPTGRHPFPYVSVRPCGDEYGGKTYFGVMLGDLALIVSGSYLQESGVLSVGPAMHNPAMFVPDLGKLIFGCGSWWGYIDSPEQLREISDADIESVWYVQALKAMSEPPVKGGPQQEPS